MGTKTCCSSCLRWCGRCAPSAFICYGWVLRSNRGASWSWTFPWALPWRSSPGCPCVCYASTGHTSDSLQRYVVIIVILVADLIFISSSHTFVLLFKAYNHGDFGLPESRVFRGLLDLLWLLAFTQLYMAFLGKVWQVGLFLFDTLAPFPDLIRQRMLYFCHGDLRYAPLHVLTRVDLHDQQHWSCCLCDSQEMIFDIYHFGIKTSPAFQSLQLMGVPSWQVFLGISKLRWSKYRCLERLTCLLSLFASFLEVPKELVAVFTWTIDAEYPHDTATYYFYFAETKVKLINVPATFDEKFRAWTFTKNAERERAAKSIRPTPVRFDLALANDAVHHSSEEWGKVCSMFADPCRFRFFQQLTIQLGGIVFCRYWPRMGCKLASSLMLLLAGPMIRLSPSKDVLNYVHDHTAPRDLVSWIVPAAMVLCDLLELLLVQWLQSADPAVIKYRLCKFARLFMDPRLLWMALSCHVCCNSDVYLTFAKLKFWLGPLKIRLFRPSQCFRGWKIQSGNGSATGMRSTNQHRLFVCV